MRILNVRINNLSREEILQKIEFILSSENKKCYQIATVNPEFILGAQKNQKFRDILNAKTSLNIADGIGIKFAGWRYGENLKCRWAGIDLMGEILKITNKNKQKVLIITHKDSLSSKNEIEAVLEKLYSGLNVEIVELSKKQRFDLGGVEQSDDERRGRISADDKRQKSSMRYDIALCNLGAPRQEILLNSFCKGPTFANAKIGPLQKPKLVMGVGGSFDFLTGKIKRAPKGLRKIGLEWLWRLILEPRYRLKRIWQAVLVFPVKVIFNK